MAKSNKTKKGLIIIYTGNGKGKTTAALGQALRTAGHGMKVCIIQFIKGSWHYGELNAIRRFDDLIDFHVMGKGFTWKSENLEKDKKIARKGWQMAQAAIGSGQYQLVILDELTYLANYNMIDTQEIVKAIAAKPESLHVVITGRSAPQELLDIADLVTEMKAVRHPYELGIKAQKGIEF